MEVKNEPKDEYFLESKENETPVEFLHRIVRDKDAPISVRMDSAKALLPYTAKKLTETSETTVTNLTVSSEALKDLTDEQLAEYVRNFENLANATRAKS